MSKGFATFLIVAVAASAHAAVVDRGATGFTVHHTFTIAAPPSRVYAAFADIGKWWNPDHSYSHDGARLSLGTTNGGCFCEALPDGGFVRHLEVAFVQPDKELRLTGGLGPLQPIGASGAMTVTFEDASGATKLNLTYAVSGYLAAGLDTWADPVDGVLLEQVQRLKRFVETGAPAEVP